MVLSGGIDDKTLNNFIPMFKNYDAKPANLHLIISSYGGSVVAGTAMYEVIRTSNNPVTTVGYGIVGSMAVLLFEAGDLRFVSEGTHFLLHDGSVGVQGNLLDVKTHLDEMLKNHHWYAEQIAQRTKLPLKKVLELVNKETYLTAEEALNLKLVDNIIPYRKFAKLVKNHEHS